MKRFLVFLLAAFVLVGVFFGGAVFGSRYQREIYYNDDINEEETKTDSAGSEVITITNELLEEMLVDYFNDGKKYDYDEFWNEFSFAEVHPDGQGVAVSAGSGGAGSVVQSWFFTSDGGKSWAFGEDRIYANGPGSIVYISDTVIRTSFGGGDVYSDNGRTLKKEVSFTEITGLSPYNGEAIPELVSADYDSETVILGFGAYDEAGGFTNKGYTYMAEFDKNLNMVKEIYKK